MSDKYSFVVVTYHGRDTAIEAFDVLKEMEKADELEVADAVAVYETKRGKIKVHKKSKLTGRKGVALFGGAGLIIGAILGGPLLGALVGAVVGGAASGWTGLTKDVKKQLKEELGPNDSALCLLIKSANWEAVQKKMAEHNFGGHILVSELTPEAVQALSQLVVKTDVAKAIEDELMEARDVAAVNEVFRSLEDESITSAAEAEELAAETAEIADEEEVAAAQAVEEKVAEEGDQAGEEK